MLKHPLHVLAQKYRKIRLHGYFVVDIRHKPKMDAVMTKLGKPHAGPNMTAALWLVEMEKVPDELLSLFGSVGNNIHFLVYSRVT